MWVFHVVLTGGSGGSHRRWGEDNSVKGVVDRSLDLKHASPGESLQSLSPDGQSQQRGG
jgi:hypothetical protein